MRWALLVCALAGCGDEMQRDVAFAAQSGTQLAIDWYRFDDGTELPDASEHYDKQLHTACRATTWLDGTTRCVPIADEAVFTDAACTMAVGHAQSIEKPTHFIAYEYRTDSILPAHVYEATKDGATVTSYYLRIADACSGPYHTSGGSYVTLGSEIDGARLAELHEDVQGEGRLGLVVRSSPDGMRVVVGTKDRTLDLDCTPELAADGSTWCAPTVAAITTRFFGDPACLEPVVSVTLASQVPTLARVIDDRGCPSYWHVGAELAPPVYRRDGQTCMRVDVESLRTFALGAPFDPIPLARDEDTEAHRRLARIVLTGDTTPLVADTLYDTATRGDCLRVPIGDTTRCLPANLASGFTVFAAGCGVTVPVALLPRHACARPQFAITSVEDGGLAVRAIGDAVTAPLYVAQGSGCAPYVPPADSDLFLLGPELPAETFEAAIHFGAR